MAANQFSWDHLPRRVLLALRRELGLPGEPVAALSAAYGHRPDVEFVRAAWPVLRRTWLTDDRLARLTVVEALQAERVGDRKISVRTEAGQLDYLRSCRNSGTLRRVVLAALLEAGAQATEPGSLALPTRCTRAWDEYADHLALTLDALEAGQFLVLLPADRPGFVQFAIEGARGMRAEAASNALLPPNQQLDERALEAAARLGWTLPGNGPGNGGCEQDASPNYVVEWPAPVPYPAAARLAVDTLTRVLGVRHPGRIRYEAFTGEGLPILLPLLGESVSGRRVADEAASVLDADAVAGLVLDVLREYSGDPELRPDDDGDIAIRYGSAAVFVQVFGEPPIVRVYAPVLGQVPLSQKVTEALNDLNRSTAFTKWLAADDSIIAAVDLFGVPMVAPHVIHACEVIGKTADDVDEELQHRFGGKTFFGECRGAKLRHETAGYL
ncbi:MAG TPA: YbjN domain-containing protein [Ilumatobacter sp.]